jgi:hypothetical protein
MRLGRGIETMKRVGIAGRPKGAETGRRSRVRKLLEAACGGFGR